MLLFLIFIQIILIIPIQILYRELKYFQEMDLNILQIILEYMAK
jgi:hypothetical protein